MNRKQIVINASTSFLQVLVMGVSLFFLYKFLLHAIGIEKLGVWSVVLATSSAMSFAKKGISGNAVKYVAQYIARKEFDVVIKVVETTVVSISLFSAIALLAMYPIAWWILTLVVPLKFLNTAHALLPYSLMSFWFMMVASCYYSSLDGYQRTDIRSWILMSGAIFLLLLAYFVVPLYGIMGLAYAQVAQGFFILVASWLMLKTKLKPLTLVPRRWDASLFKEMVGYSFNLQLINVFQTVSEPLTKALLVKFGGLTMAGYYEMASRMVIQFRTLIVSANQVMVPTIADVYERSSKNVLDIYRASYRLILYIALPFFSFVVILVPAISSVWIGHYESSFVVFSDILILGWFINTIIGPSYFSNLGIGEVKWNTIGHALIALLNVVLGFLLGAVFDGVGVVTGWVIAIDIGSLFIAYMYHKRYSIPISEFLPTEHRLVIITCLAGLSAAYFVHYFLVAKLGTLIVTNLMLLVFVCFVGIPIWKHPLRKSLTVWMGNILDYVRKYP